MEQRMMLRAILSLMLALLFRAAINGEEITIVVNETAGLYRGNFPVNAAYNWPEPVVRDRQFKLLQNGKIIPAQFQPVQAGDKIQQFEVDFRATLAPYASAEFTIKPVEQSDVIEPIRGFQLQKYDQGMRLINDPYLHWRIDNHLKGVLDEFQFGKSDFWDPQDSALVLKLADGSQVKVTGNEKGDLKVLKTGPWAVQFNYSLDARQLGLRKVKSNVTLSFDVSRSWVRVDWRVDDPAREVKALAVPMKIKLSEPSRQNPTLIDFGTTTQIYSSLSGSQSAELRANYDYFPREPKYVWEVLKQDGNKMRQLAVGRQQSGERSLPEGWAHIMDSRKCLALAVDKFGQDANDVIRLAADGRFYLQRTPVDRGRLRTGKYIQLRYWLHFVFNPQEVSAATSPQSMKTPLEVHLK